MKKGFKTLMMTLLTLTSFSSFADDNKIEVGYVDLGHNEFTEKKYNENTEYEVLYFFNYGCSFCNSFERTLDIYLDNVDNVNFVYKPIYVQEAWNEYAKAFYVGQNLEIPHDQYHKKMFDDVHINKNKLLTKKELEKYFSREYNTPSGAFHTAYNSYSVTYKMKQNEKLADQFNVSGTPTLVIISKNGETYKVSPNISGGVFNMIATLVLLTN